MRRPLRFARLALLASPLVLVACGGRVNPDLSADPDARADAGSDTSTPFEDSSVRPDLGPPPTDGIVPPPLDGAPPPFDIGPTDAIAPPPPSICNDLADAICTKYTAACCSAHGTTYVDSKCRDAEISYCKYELDWVATGRLTYDGSQLASCEGAWTKAFATCGVFFVDWLKLYEPCTRVFNGVLKPGDACSYDIECMSPPKGEGYCDPTSKKCKQYDVVGKGAGCNFTGRVIHYCDAGLFCDTTSTTPTCLPEKPLGSACDGTDDLSCGYLHACVGGTCQKGLPAGAACDASAAIQCASWTCTGGKCTDPNVSLADASVCGG